MNPTCINNSSNFFFFTPTRPPSRDVLYWLCGRPRTSDTPDAARARFFFHRSRRSVGCRFEFLYALFFPLPSPELGISPALTSVRRLACRSPAMVSAKLLGHPCARRRARVGKSPRPGHVFVVVLHTPLGPGALSVCSPTVCPQIPRYKTLLHEAYLFILFYFFF